MAAKSRKDDSAFFASLIVKHATDSMVFTDLDGLTVWANEPFVKMSGYQAEELFGKKPGSVLQGPDTDPETVSKIREAITAQRPIRTQILNYTKDGSPYWIDLTINPVFNENHQLTHFMSIERDITKSKLMAQQTSATLEEERGLRQERKVLSQMSEWLFAAQTMDELKAVVTRSMAHLFPGTNGELFIYSNSRDALDRASVWGTPSGTQHLHANECWALRRGRGYAYGMSEIDFACEHVESEYHPYFCLPITAHGETIGLLHLAFPEHHLHEANRHELNDELAPLFELAQICAEQISLAAANVRLHVELQDRSVKDTLTGLWNRRWFLDMAKRETRRAGSEGFDLSLIMIDADHLKKYNDIHGHDAGDAVLKMLAGELSAMAGDNIFPCRIGGEEFAIICSRCTAEEAKLAMDSLSDRLAAAHLIHSGSKLPNITISAGIAGLNPGEILQSLMKRADLALYEAKDSGRNRTIIAPRHRAQSHAETIEAA